MPAHLHCWFTIWNRGGGRRRDLNAAALLDAIPRTAFVTRGSGFRLASNRGDAFKRVEEALSGAGEVVMASPARIFGNFDFQRSLRRGNHARTMLRAWVCRRQDGSGVFQLVLADLAGVG
ncbi:hypothetical protein Taro_004256 [Colocasia esculenta]|uniref:Uncharacterized protein n=1 Tax=Colocasia esculenta TaxID=4460 RepID=A0A843TR50_COLES|nr:hypothetical protein [Colocasia esculenta]